MFVFRMLEHYQRLLQSTKILMMSPKYTARQLCDYTLELLRLEGYRTDAYIRPLAYKSNEIIGVRLHDLNDDLSIWSVPYNRYVERRRVRTSASVVAARQRQQRAPRGKITGAYVNSAFIKTEAVKNGYDEALVLNDRGYVCEGSAENIFLPRGALITPPVQEDILEGITRATIMELAREELGLQTVERADQPHRVLRGRRSLFLRHGRAGRRHHPVRSSRGGQWPHGTGRRCDARSLFQDGTRPARISIVTGARRSSRRKPRPSVNQSIGQPADW
ncbi:MAG: aminotransferase class IV [Marinilabiliales bacterium]|nr:aminotransferase class IV [Marinilabiliales bacterium]